METYCQVLPNILCKAHKVFIAFLFKESLNTVNVSFRIFLFVFMLFVCFVCIPLVHLFLYVFIDVVDLRLKLLPSLLWRKMTEVLRIRTLRGDRE